MRKLLNELRAIAAWHEIKTSKAFADAVVAATAGLLQFAKHLITNPVDTLTGVPRGAAKFMEEALTGVTASTTRVRLRPRGAARARVARDSHTTVRSTNRIRSPV